MSGGLQARRLVEQHRQREVTIQEKRVRQAADKAIASHALRLKEVSLCYALRLKKVSLRVPFRQTT